MIWNSKNHTMIWKWKRTKWFEIVKNTPWFEIEHILPEIRFDCGDQILIISCKNHDWAHFFIYSKKTKEKHAPKKSLVHFCTAFMMPYKKISKISKWTRFFLGAKYRNEMSKNALIWSVRFFKKKMHESDSHRWGWSLKECVIVKYIMIHRCQDRAGGGVTGQGGGGAVLGGSARSGPGPPPPISMEFLLIWWFFEYVCFFPGFERRFFRQNRPNIDQNGTFSWNICRFLHKSRIFAYAAWHMRRLENS